MPRARARLLGAFLIVAAIAGLLAWRSAADGPRATGPVGLFTTLPILWAESPDIGTALNPMQSSTGPGRS